MKKIMLSVLLVLTAFSVGFTQSYRKPGKRDIVLVFSVGIQPGINRDFFKKYLDISISSGLVFKNSIKISSKTGLFSKDKDPVDFITLSFDSDSSLIETEIQSPVEDILSVIIKPESGKRDFYLDYFSYDLFGGTAFRIFLPAYVTISVPEDAQYVYLGHLEYTLKSDNSFEFIGVKKRDNFDDAAKIIKERYGDAAQLIRVPLIPRNHER